MTPPSFEADFATSSNLDHNRRRPPSQEPPNQRFISKLNVSTQPPRSVRQGKSAPARGLPPLVRNDAKRRREGEATHTLATKYEFPSTPTTGYWTETHISCPDHINNRFCHSDRAWSGLLGMWIAFTSSTEPIRQGAWAPDRPTYRPLRYLNHGYSVAVALMTNAMPTNTSTKRVRTKPIPMTPYAMVAVHRYMTITALTCVWPRSSKR